MSSTDLRPLVSVLITTYNREKLLPEALESVFACTYPNLEIIVVDDCSADNTAALVETYAKSDSRIRFYRNDRNLGDYPNRNRAASYVRGEYFTYLDSDDKMISDGLERCIKCLLDHREAGIGMYWTGTGNIECPPPMSSKEAILYHFFKRPYLTCGPGGTVLKKSFFDSVGGYPEKYGPANDMYFNLKAACQTTVVLFPFSFYEYRRHDAQESSSWYGYLFNNYIFLKDALTELPLPLDKKQKNWISVKNKRRFLITLIRYLFITRNLGHVRTAIRKTGFSLRDCVDAIIH